MKTNVNITDSDLVPAYGPAMEWAVKRLSSEKLNNVEVADIVSSDQSLAAAALKLANKKLDGDGAVSSIKNCVGILGQDSIKVMATTILKYAVSEKYEHKYFSMHQYWKYSMTVALICGSIAKHIKRFEAINIENLYAAGLLHDFGIPIILSLNKSLFEFTIKKNLKDNTPFHIGEETISHSDICSDILSKWNYPQRFINIIMNHHTPSNASKDIKSTAIVHIADVTAQLVGFTPVLEVIPPEIDEFAFKEVGLSPERLNVIARESIDKVHEIENLFKV